MDWQNQSTCIGMEHRNILFVRLLVVSICASCWACLRWQCSLQEAFRTLFREAKCTNTRREGWGERIWFWYRYTQALIYLSFPTLSYLFIHISFISSGCIYISESEKERECYISEHAIYLSLFVLSPAPSSPSAWTFLLCRLGSQFCKVL